MKCFRCNKDLPRKHLGGYCNRCINRMVDENAEYERKHQGKSPEAMHLSLWQAENTKDVYNPETGGWGIP